MNSATATNLAYAGLLIEGSWKSHALAQLNAARESGGGPECAALLARIAGALGDPGRPDLSLSETPLAIVRHSRILSTLHLRTLEDPVLQKLAFKQGVNYIDLETSSQCNRRCSYCTNSLNDRISANSFIEEEVLERFLDQLAEIDYDQEIHFAGYNEPLMHREHILAAIRRTRARLPRANLVVFSNGDFLDRSYLEELAGTGLNSINLSIHTAPGQAYSDGEMVGRVMQMGKRLGIDPVLKGFEKGCYVDASFPHPRLCVAMYHKDYAHLGHDRGGLLEEVGDKHERSAACFAPLTQFIVSYRGDVMPCCVLVSDDPQHEPCRVGRLDGSQNIFEIYSGARFVAWRRALLRLGTKSGPCRTCSGEANFADLNDQGTFARIAGHLQEQESAEGC